MAKVAAAVEPEGLRSILLGRRLVGVGVVEDVRAITSNPYLSRISSSIIEVRTSAAGDLRVLAKVGDREVTREGSPWGTPYEAEIYRCALPMVTAYRSPYLGCDVREDRVWLFLRWLDVAVRVGQHRDPGAMVRAAEWLGRFHRTASHAGVTQSCEVVTRFGSGVPTGWAHLALSNLRRLDLGSRSDLTRIEALAPMVQGLLTSEATLIHGDFFPSNVLVDGTSVVPIDWEWAAIAAGEVDLAALVSGWPEPTVKACQLAYWAERWPRGDGGDMQPRLHAAHCYFALRALGRRSLSAASEDVEGRLRTTQRAYEHLT